MKQLRENHDDYEKYREAVRGALTHYQSGWTDLDLGTIDNWYFYIYDNDNHEEVSDTELIHTSAENIFDAPIIIPKQGVTFCIHNKDWSVIYTCFVEESDENSQINLSKSDSASGLINLNVNIYLVIFDETEKLLKFEGKGLILYTTSDGHPINNTYTQLASLHEFDEYLGYYKLAFNEKLLNISNSAFLNSNLASIIIPSTVVNIGLNSFKGCSLLSSVIIPEGVLYIKNGAFLNCTSLSSVVIPNSVINIEGNAFLGSGITYVTLSKNTVLLGTCFPSNREITIDFIGNIIDWNNKTWPTYYISESYQLLFNGELQEEIIFPSEIVEVSSAFWGCTSLTSVTIHNNVENILLGAFRGCPNLHTVILGNGITKLNNLTFYSCSNLTSIEIPNTVSEIGEYAFYNCSKIDLILIPNSVTTIGTSAFYNVKKIILPSGKIPSGKPWGALSVELPENHVLCSIDEDQYVFDSTRTLLDLGFETLYSKSLHRPEEELPLIDTSVVTPQSEGKYYTYCDINEWPVVETVDLGLSVKWMQYNYGVDPSNLGSVSKWYGSRYYRWGEVNDTYNGAKYGLNTVLNPEDDMITVNYGPECHLPTAEQYAELKDTSKITATWVSNYGGVSGLKGRTFVSKVPGFVGNKIFIPAAGSNKTSAGSAANYWSSTSDSTRSTNAISFSFDSNSYYESFPRDYYFYLRGVQDK